MIRILILDDDQVRHDNFAQRFNKLGVVEPVHCKNIDQFERILTRESKFDVILLDHDLNDFGKNSVLSGCYGDTELTGHDAAVLVTTLPPEKRPTIVIIHSWNSDGAKSMNAVLQQAGINSVIDIFPVKNVTFEFER